MLPGFVLIFDLIWFNDGAGSDVALVVDSAFLGSSYHTISSGNLGHIMAVFLVCKMINPGLI